MKFNGKQNKSNIQGILGKSKNMKEQKYRDRQIKECPGKFGRKVIYKNERTSKEIIEILRNSRNKTEKLLKSQGKKIQIKQTRKFLKHLGNSMEFWKQR